MFNLHISIVIILCFDFWSDKDRFLIVDYSCWCQNIERICKNIRRDNLPDVTLRVKWWKYQLVTYRQQKHWRQETLETFETLMLIKISVCKLSINTYLLIVELGIDQPWQDCLFSYNQPGLLKSSSFDIYSEIHTYIDIWGLELPKTKNELDSSHVMCDCQSPRFSWMARRPCKRAKGLLLNYM